MKAAKTIVGPYYAFTHKGNVYARLPDDTKMAVKSDTDLAVLKNKVDTPRNFINKSDKVNKLHPPVSTSKNSHQPLIMNTYSPPSSQQVTFNESSLVTNHAGFDAHQTHYLKNHLNSRGGGMVSHRGSVWSRGRGNSRGQYHRGRGGGTNTYYNR